jgi:hypothetical protein
MESLFYGAQNFEPRSFTGGPTRFYLPLFFDIVRQGKPSVVAGRIYVDSINLCSDGGWRAFETHRAFSPQNRPAHMTQNSIPQEIETYLRQAGFSDVWIRTDDDWIRASTIKPKS